MNRDKIVLAVFQTLKAYAMTTEESIEGTKAVMRELFPDAGQAKVADVPF